MNHQRREDLLTVLDEHDLCQLRLGTCMRLADTQAARTRIYRITLHCQERTAEEIELLYSRNGNQNVPDPCADCGSWTFDGRCGCDAQQRELLGEQLIGSMQWAHEMGVE